MPEDPICPTCEAPASSPLCMLDLKALAFDLPGLYDHDECPSCANPVHGKTVPREQYEKLEAEIQDHRYCDIMRERMDTLLVDGDRLTRERDELRRLFDEVVGGLPSSCLRDKARAYQQAHPLEVGRKCPDCGQAVGEP